MGLRPTDATELFLVHEVAAAVLLPALLVRLRAERFLLAIADRFHMIGSDSALCQSVADRIGAAIPQSQIVFGRTALVAVSLNRKIDVGMLFQEPDIPLKCRLLIRPNFAPVVIEVDVFDVL